MTHSFDLTTALVADRQRTLREEAHHHRLGRIARRRQPRSAAPRGAGVAVAPLPAATPTTRANPRERTAA